MKWLIAVLTAFFQALLPWVAKQSRPTAQDAAPDQQTRDKLRAKVRKHFPVVAVVLPILLITGCGVRTVYVPHGTPVRLRETIKDAKVWVKDADGQVIAGEMNLPEGWYCLPVDDEE